MSDEKTREVPLTDVMESRRSRTSPRKPCRPSTIRAEAGRIVPEADGGPGAEEVGIAGRPNRWKTSGQDMRGKLYFGPFGVRPVPSKSADP